MNKTFIWIGCIVVAIIALVMLGKSGATIEPAFQAGVIHPMDNVKGNASSSVVIMEYSDFECPACRAYYPVIREITTEFKDRIAFVYRNFPLTSIHPNAEFAARAAQAAAKQGKFWEMHDLLFEKQDEWAQLSNVEPMFESYAKLAGLNIEQFRSDFGSSGIRNFVKAQRAYAVQLGLQGTPTFFINGKQINNPTSVEEFKSLINDAIKNSKV